MKHQQIEAAIERMEYQTDRRRPPNERRRGQFRVGWEDAVTRGMTYTESTLRSLTWRNAGYRLGQLLGKGPYMDTAYDVLVRQWEAGPLGTPPSSALQLGQHALSRLDRLLDRFAQYRTFSEANYLTEERTYKDDLFDKLEQVWDALFDDPDGSRKTLLGLMDGTDSQAVKAVNNLLGNRGYVTREQFVIYLRDVAEEEYRSLMTRLFEAKAAPSVRLREFRDSVNEAYKGLYTEGRFHEALKNPPRVPQSLVAILLASYDRHAYILYRPSDYGATAKWLGLQAPSDLHHAYDFYLDMASYILAYAQGRGQAVNDLLDVHNMIYMFRQYDEFEAVGNPVQHNSSDESIYDFLRNQGFIFPDWLVTDYALSLATKPFVILSGISGTGKTKLAQLVAEYVLRSIGYDDGQAFVSVRPDWTDNSHLLGWYNAISEQYEATPVLRLIGRASDTPEKPHFIILDEMNIARVEHYFSDFLSCMESRWIDASGTLHQAPIQLHSRGNDDEAGELDVAPQVDLPLNVYVIGTVNVDESTYMFSPKVLDRASVIELNDVCLDASSVDDTTAPYSGQFLLRSGVALSSILARYKPVTHHRLDEMREKMPGQFRQLLAIQAALRQHHRHFGYRVASEIAAFMVNAQQYCVECEAVLPIAFDLQVMQKILPKLHGNAAQLHGPLESLAEAIPSSCLLSHAKIARMQSRLQQIGFASFID